MAAGDIACDPASRAFRDGKGTERSCHEMLTSDILVRSHPDAVLALGDDQYQCGTLSSFERSYDRSWGRVKRITHPVPGNHEYGRSCHSDDPSGYFRYFGRAAGSNPGGWYSFDLGTWHLIALNSECSYGRGRYTIGGCGRGSPQETWLRRDLETHPNECTLAYWHEPRFSSGEHGDAQQMADIWNDLVRAHADVVLSGHNHDYERFAPIGYTPRAKKTPGVPSFQDPNLDPKGIREFVVGTGGKNHYGFYALGTRGAVPPLRGEQVRNADTFGVLKLTLYPDRYSWEFVPEPGHAFTDKGSGACH